MCVCVGGGGPQAVAGMRDRHESPRTGKTRTGSTLAPGWSFASAVVSQNKLPQAANGAGTKEADLALPALLLRRLLRGNMKAAIYFDNKQRGLGLHSGDAEELFWVY